MLYMSLSRVYCATSYATTSHDNFVSRFWSPNQELPHEFLLVFFPTLAILMVNRGNNNSLWEEGIYTSISILTKSQFHRTLLPICRKLDVHKSRKFSDNRKLPITFLIPFTKSINKTP
jgi:hypothetical protein